jgi:hypothetical protein
MIFTMALELFWLYDIYDSQNSSKGIVNIIQSEQF